MSRKLTCDQCGTPIAKDAPNGMCPKCLLGVARHGEQQVAATRAVNPEQPKPPKPEQIAKLFPELEILDLIGQGGMGFVYKARQKNLGRLVAVKLLSPTGDPAFAERFTREARAMAMLNHPSIISIYDFGQRGQYYFLTMEYVDGLNLRQLVSQTKMETAEALELVPKLCDALQYAHDNGIVHRDIKPENVLLSQRGDVKIADFGLAKLVGNQPDHVSLTNTRQVMGTLNYMAPEQMERPTEVDHRADIYSLGVVIYELLTGELPLGKFSPPSQKVEVDVRLDEVVMRALEKEPKMRFQQASDFKTGIESFSGYAPARYVAAKRKDTPEERAIKIVKFSIISVAMVFCFAGALSIVFSGLDFEIIPEDTWRVLGFSLLAIGGLIFALFGVLVHYFFPEPEKHPAQPKKASSQSKDSSPLTTFVSILAIFMMFAAGLMFVGGSGSIAVIPEHVSRFGGIACAIFGAFLFTVMGILSGDEEEDE